LVENREGIDLETFRNHWLRVHGPLAKALPGLRRYSQNHVVEHLPVKASAALHHVDGLSQLYYDDIKSMIRACDSPENQRCIEDIRGYFSHVTVIVTDPKVMLEGAAPGSASLKLMVVLVGDDTGTEAYRGSVAELLRRKSNGTRYIHNAVIDRSQIVDASVPRSDQVVTGLSEFWFGDRAKLDEALKAGLLNLGAGQIQPAVAVVVKEHKVL
jgi:uncharacterized protein (TIGR02118 family)